MHLSLSMVMARGSEATELTADHDRDLVSIGRDRYKLTDATPIKVRAEKVDTRSVALEVKTTFSLELSCSRCLQPVIYPFDIDVSYRYDVSDDGSATIDDDEEKVSYIDGYDLDIDGLIDEEVMIGFPMKVLCEEDCKGLCKVCGANLNKGECGCDRTEPDPRMSIIKDLFNMKEV